MAKVLGANGFGAAQQKVLRRILRANAGSSLYSHLNLTKLGAYRDFELMYQAYIRAVPVQSPRSYLESLAKLLQPAGQTPLQILNNANLVVRGRPMAATVFRMQPLPVDKALLEDFLAAEVRIGKQIRVQGMAAAGAFYYLNEVEPQVSVQGQLPMRGWHAMADEGRGWLARRHTLPRTGQMPNAGNSRYQWFSAHWDQLKTVGKDVGVLVVSPKTLLDFALYVSQQEGRFVPLVHWCPNLKVLVLNGYDMSLQRVEMSYLLAGLPEVKWLQWFYQPGGLSAWQGDLNIRQRLTLPGEGSTFYEFVPMDDVYPDGRFMRNYRRLHGGQLEVGKEYLTLLTNTAGWLSVSSGQIIKTVGPVDEQPCLRLTVEGPAVRLNGLAEGFREKSVIEALANINKALQGHGVFLRDAVLGHHVTERQPVWALEISRPLPEVNAALMESIARRLHGELELRHEVYRNNLRQANIRGPQVHFVPIGTFAAATPQAGEATLFDHSAEAAVVKKVVEAAWASHLVELQ